MFRKYYSVNSKDVKIINSDNGEDLATAVVIEDTLLTRVNAGRVFTASLDLETVANNGEVYILIETGETPLHLVFDVKSVGQWRFESFIDPTVSDNGTELTIFNRKSDSTTELQANLYQGSTITDEGNPRLSFRFGSGTNQGRVTTAEQRSDLDSLIASNSLFLMKFTNESGSSSYLSVIGDIYEDAEL